MDSNLKIVLRVYEFVKEMPRKISEIEQKFSSQPERAVEAVEVLDELGKIRVDQHKFSETIAHGEFRKDSKKVLKRVKKRK